MDTTTSTRTVIGVFDNDSTAHQAVEQLATAGFSRDRIEVSSGHSYGDDAARGNTGLTGNAPSDRSGGGIGGFLSRLFGSDEDNERDAYAEVVWHVVREYAALAGIDKLAPHDLRRTCARLCHAAGGELEQIQFLLGHVSIQTTERYLGCKQRIRAAVNDRIGIEPKE